MIAAWMTPSQLTSPRRPIVSDVSTGSPPTANRPRATSFVPASLVTNGGSVNVAARRCRSRRTSTYAAVRHVERAEVEVRSHAETLIAPPRAAQNSSRLSKEISEWFAEP